MGKNSLSKNRKEINQTNSLLNQLTGKKMEHQSKKKTGLIDRKCKSDIDGILSDMLLSAVTGLTGTKEDRIDEQNQKTPSGTKSMYLCSSIFTCSGKTSSG